MIIIFDLFETILDNVSIDFNAGLLPLWEKYYRDKCTFDDNGIGNYFEKNMVQCGFRKT